MTPNLRWTLLGSGAALVACAAILTAVLTPRKPDLMARAVKVADLTGMNTFQLHWLDSHRLVTTKGGWPYSDAPSILAIDVSTRAVAPLPAIDATLRRITRTHPLNLTQVIPSPDGQWLLCAPGSETFGSATTMRPRLIRVRDGRYLTAGPLPESCWVEWLPDSRHWITRSYAPGSSPVVCSVDDPLKAHPAPPLKADWYSHAKHMDANETGDFLGSGRTLVAEKSYHRKRLWDGYGVVSPDRTRIAWLRQDDWPDIAPLWIRRILAACHYRLHPSGEVWTVHLDGTGRREVGTFGGESSGSAELEDFDWTPDSKSLIFVRGSAWREGVLYMVSAGGSAPR